MAIHSFLKAERGDPDWQFSPDSYFGKEFKIIDAALVELDEGRADIVVLRQNPTEKELLAKHLRIHVQQDAALELIIINDVDRKLQQVFLYDIYLKSGSDVSMGVFVKDGKFNKHIIQVYLEEGSRFTSYGLIENSVGGDTEVITKIVHQGPESASHQMFLGLAGEDSQTVYQGMIIAEENAIASEVSTESSNLVIGENGRCFSKPETDIDADFVRISQASEIDTISLEKIGYLQSRGISEESAREMIITGFRDQVLSLVSDNSIRQEIKGMYIN